ncbi:TetR/AcrR family transcriptional regulator [Rhodococcus aerolatus]
MAYRRTPAVQARLDATRAELLSAAHALVAEHGYAGCTVTALAARAGVGTGTVYRFWPGKGELFAEVFRVACAREVRAFTDAAEVDGCVCTRLTAAVGTFARRALAAPRLAHALLVEPVDPLVDVERLAFRAAYRDLLTTLLDAGVAAGQVPAQDTATTAAGVIGAIAEALVAPLAAGHAGPGATPGTVDSLTLFTTRAIGGRHDDHPRGHQPGAAAAGARRG